MLLLPYLLHSAGPKHDSRFPAKYSGGKGCVGPGLLVSQSAYLVCDGHTDAQHGEDGLVVRLCGAHEGTILSARHMNLTLCQR